MPALSPSTAAWLRGKAVAASAAAVVVGVERVNINDDVLLRLCFLVVVAGFIIDEEAVTSDIGVNSEAPRL